MEKTQAVYQAIRRRLTTATTLVSQVATLAITVENQKARATYPAITFRVVAATGRSFKNFISGDIYLNVWSQSDSYARQIASIYGIVYDRLHECEASLCTTNLGVGIMREEYANYPMYEDEIETYYLASRWSFAAQKR